MTCMLHWTSLLRILSARTAALLLLLVLGIWTLHHRAASIRTGPFLAKHFLARNTTPASVHVDSERKPLSYAHIETPRHSHRGSHLNATPLEDRWRLLDSQPRRARGSRRAVYNVSPARQAASEQHAVENIRTREKPEAATSGRRMIPEAHDPNPVTAAETHGATLALDSPARRQQPRAAGAHAAGAHAAAASSRPRPAAERRQREKRAPVRLPPGIAFFNPSAAWLKEPRQVVIVARFFNGTGGRTWYPGQSDWRAGSVRNFIGENCLVAAFGWLAPSSAGRPPRLRVQPSTVQHADACPYAAETPWSARARIEDARLFVRADGGYQLLYTRAGAGDEARVHAAPLAVDAPAKRARIELSRHVEMCRELLLRLGQGGTQKNWSPFAFAGRDYLVYSIAPLRVWRADYDSGACEEVQTATAPQLHQMLAQCSSVEAAPARAQQRLWRQCTGAEQRFPRQEESPRDFYMAFGGGTPGVVLPPADASGDEREGRMLFMGHSRLYAQSAALLERVSPLIDEIGPEREWHRGYNKLYRLFWYTLRPTWHGGGEHGRRNDGDGAFGGDGTLGGDGSGERHTGSELLGFEMDAMSQLFVPPATVAKYPKIVFATGLLFPQSARGALLSRGPLTVFYGESDVYSHAWSLGMQRVRAALMPLPLLQNMSLARRNPWGGAEHTDFSAAFYGSPLCAQQCAAAPDLKPSKTCSELGFRLLWNSAIVPLPGVPNPNAVCRPLRAWRVDSLRMCCAACQQQPSCTSWTYYSPKCYWSESCASNRSESDAQLMWGAISGWLPQRRPRLVSENSGVNGLHRR